MANSNTTPLAPATRPLHEHGAFMDMEEYLRIIQLGADALKGLGNMMQPEVDDPQMNMAHISDAASVFRFFGEVLDLPAQGASDSLERLQRAAKGELV